MSIALSQPSPPRDLWDVANNCFSALCDPRWLAHMSAREKQRGQTTWAAWQLLRIAESERHTGRLIDLVLTPDCDLDSGLLDLLCPKYQVAESECTSDCGEQRVTQVRREVVFTRDTVVLDLSLSGLRLDAVPHRVLIDTGNREVRITAKIELEPVNDRWLAYCTFEGEVRV